MSEEKPVKKYSFAELLSDALGVLLILFICEACGCHVFRGIGNAVGSCVDAYNQAAHQIHPSDIR